MIGLLVFSLLVNCRVVPEAPHGAVPKRRHLVSDAYGGWIQFRVPLETAGELIAVAPDSLYVLEETGLRVLPLTDIPEAEVYYYRTAQQGFIGTTMFTSILSLLNGPSILVTLPLTVTIGILTIRQEGKRINRYGYPANSWSALSAYARFPQGLPASIDRAALRQKPGIRLHRGGRRG